MKSSDLHSKRPQKPALLPVFTDHSPHWDWPYIRRRSPYSVRVKRYSGDADSLDMTIFSFYNDLEYAVPENSLNDPANAHGAYTVAAIDQADWQQASPSQEPYSSQGPTNDGRPKPDIAAPDGTTSLTYGPTGSFGTSFSSPTTAGAAALLLELLLEEDSGAGATDLANGLSTLAVDIGDPGHDSIFGAGKLLLADLPPAAPANLNATGADTAVDLDWDDNVEPDLAGYNIHRSLTSGGPYAQINGLLVDSTYTDNGVINDITYFYVVTAVDSAGNESVDSAEVSATPGVVLPVDDAMHIGSIVASTVDAGKGRKHARATVLVVDNNGEPVVGAFVTVSFTGGINESQVEGFTGANGQVILTSSTTVKGKLKFMVCVYDVFLAGLCPMTLRIMFRTAHRTRIRPC